MKKVGALFVLLCLLSACTGKSNEIERGMALRSRLLRSQSCSFDARITADYGDKIHKFAVACQADQNGGIIFAVTEPETISGITGTLSGGSGKLTFDGTALQFDLMADDQLTPVSAPWIFYNTLRCGYLTSAGMDGELVRLSIDDSYEEEALHLDIWLNEQDIPVRAEILYEGRRILSLDVENVVIV